MRRWGKSGDWAWVGGKGFVSWWCLQGREGGVGRCLRGCGDVQRDLSGRLDLQVCGDGICQLEVPL